MLLNRLISSYLIRLMVILITSLFYAPDGKAQVNSNAGTEFWVPFPTHIPDIDNQQNVLYAKMSIFITSDHNSSGTVTANAFSQNFTVVANQVTEIQVPRDGVYIDNVSENSAMRVNHAIHIKVADGAPKVVVYAHIFAGNRSAATLVLPKEALGQDYYSMNFPQNNYEGSNLIDIVSIEPNTRVFLRKGNTDVIPGGVLLENANDVFQFSFTNDLTGVHIYADPASSGCKRFAVFSGSSAINISSPRCNSPSKDPLFQQCYPVESWGTKYGFIPFSMQSINSTSPVRTRGQYLRVLARENGTEVRLNGSVVAVLDQGEFYSSPEPVSQPTLIESSHPVAVAQFALSQNCATIEGPWDTKYSDPDMVILNPVSYNIRDITIYSSSKEHILEQYVNVLIKSSAAASFRINGQPPSTPFIPAASIPGYSYNQIDLTNYPVQTFRLNADDGFNAIAYGFGYVESYSYSAGTNLASTISVTGVRNSDQASIDSACKDEDISFRLTLPFISPKITWQVDGSTVTEQISPAYTIVNDENRTSYLYTLPKPASLAQPGSYHFKVTAAYNILTGGCNNGEEVADYIFKVLAKPVPVITQSEADCSGNVQFSAPVKAEGQLLTGYQWDFGDGSGGNNTANGRVVSHRFSASGNYTVKLTVLSAAGCQAEATTPVNVRVVLPSFTGSNGSCAGDPVSFSAQPVAGFIPVKWTWDFGDNVTMTTTTGNIAHTYMQSGTYTVSLTLTNAAGCVSAVKIIQQRIFSKPVSDFSVQQSCAGAPALFTAAINGQETGLEYTWDFSDPAASSEDNRSVVASPTHQYTSPGQYTVTLKLRNSSGCEGSVTKTVTISGPPRADFEILTNNLCSGTPIIIRNSSSVGNGGPITRIDVYFDSATDPDNKTTYPAPAIGQEFRYSYPVFTNTPTREVTIRLVAWSGNTCSDEKTKTFTLNAAPQLTFTGPEKICINDGPVQLNGGVSNSVQGSGSFSGSGVSTTGLFTPGQAGAGIHRITYHFLTTGGCESSKELQIEVKPEIHISGQTEYTTGENAVKLMPIYNGEPTTYTWSPANGLSNPNSASPLAGPLATTIYTVTASNGFCEQKMEITVRVAPELEISNSFTPNNDGINDYFNIGNLNSWPGATVNIFTRYGAPVYESRGQYKPWDGRYRGKELPAGVYYYVILSGDGKKKKSGSVTIIR